MTLADRIAAAIIKHGPMAECHLATTVRKRTDVVSAELEGNHDRFVHNGLRARASRWNVREPVRSGVDAGALAARCEVNLELDPQTAASFVTWWIERGFLERVNGNGAVRVTELGVEESLSFEAARRT